MTVIVGLVDVDFDPEKSTWANRALMRLSAHHKAQGDRILFPFDGATKVDRVYISGVFSRNRPRIGKWLRQLTGRAWDISQPFLVDMELPDWIQVGGTAWNIHRKLAPEVAACRDDYPLYESDGLLGKIDYGQGPATEGCPRGCEFCVVPEMSGQKVEPVATLAQLRNGTFRKIRLMDDNLLANADYAAQIMEEAIEGRYKVSYTQGLDIRFLTPRIADLLKRGGYKNEGFTRPMLTFAYDGPHIGRIFERNVGHLWDAGIRQGTVQSYVLTGFNTSPDLDFRRIQDLLKWRVSPYITVFEAFDESDLIDGVPLHYVKHPEALDHVKAPGLTLRDQYVRHFKWCKHLQRVFARPAIAADLGLRYGYRAVADRFDHYERWIKEKARWGLADTMRREQQTLF